MPVSRPVLASMLAATASLALLAGCTSTPDGSDPGSASATDEGGAPAAPVWNTSPASVAAIGDSITRAFDACSVLSDCPEVSWATGTDPKVPSLAQQLAAEESWNLAESGAQASDLPSQARAVTAHEPELVTIMVGANDACAPDPALMTETEDFRADIERAVEIIRESLPDTQLYVASVPDLLRLWSEGSGSALARTVWGVAAVCPSMLADPVAVTTEAGERRDSVRERVVEYNAVLESVCAADVLCRYDGGAVFDYAFTPDDLSKWDWFHPSAQGQAALAALAHERITME
ncbi:GDSL-type esterase/lipase family protein [Streptomyces sp. XM4011]|uniref:GDSL-type esterase/lipase family protein n=1 Tax=Streptomyces TaxID=1883 RepID=UPI001FFC06DD|nr:GDSL-type esterase/lipase family protein [Streptomyces sp. XM4011]MCK1814263.1 GDSL-type esterase/lipase family protein [Streptomyces sp. XM4011]